MGAFWWGCLMEWMKYFHKFPLRIIFLSAFQLITHHDASSKKSFVIQLFNLTFSKQLAFKYSSQQFLYFVFIFLHFKYFLYFRGAQWCSQLSIPLLVSAQVVITRSWDRAQHRALHLECRVCLRILLPLPLPPTCARAHARTLCLSHSNNL